VGDVVPLALLREETHYLQKGWGGEGEKSLCYDPQCIYLNIRQEGREGKKVDSRYFLKRVNTSPAGERGRGPKERGASIKKRGEETSALSRNETIVVLKQRGALRAGDCRSSAEEEQETLGLRKERRRKKEFVEI